MYHRLQKLRAGSLVKSAGNQEQLDIIEGYLALLSALSCVDKSNSWILYPDLDSPYHTNKKIDQSSKNNETKQRQVLDIVAIRKEYIEELKRMQNILDNV